MDKKSKENIEEVVKGLNDTEIQNDVDVINLEDPLYSLKSTIFNFFKLRLIDITKESSFKEIVKAKLMKKIEEDEVSISQLIGLYSDITSVENSSIFTLLDVFKPTKDGAISPLANDMSKDETIQSMKDVSPEDMEALGLLTAFIKNMPKDSAE